MVKKLTKRQLLRKLVKHYRRLNMSSPVTLATVINHLKKRFGLNEVSGQVLSVVAVWRYDKDDLREQPKYCLELVYYLTFVPLEYGPKNNSKKA